MHSAGAGEDLSVGRRGLVAEPGMWTRGVEIRHPVGNGATGMIEAEEQYTSEGGRLAVILL